MAPEMITHTPHDHRIDIWCLGILLYELVHGFPPFKGLNEHEKLTNIVNGQKIEFDEDIPNDLKDLISNILKVKAL